MRNCIRLTIVVMSIACILGIVSVSCAQDKETTKTEEVYIQKSTLVEKVKGGEIDWGNQMFFATGEGVMPSPSQEPNRAKAYLKAKGYARMQAIAHLLMVIEGTAISYEGYGKDYMAQDETLRQKIEGFVRGVEIQDEQKIAVEGDTIVRVTVSTKMYGKANPGTAFLEKVADSTSTPTVEKPKVQVEIPKESPKPVEPIVVKPEAQVGPFTSVIIDTRGFNVSRAMSPKIRREDGSEVWGTIRVTPEFALDTGIVSYARTMEAARGSSRCGNNPLIIRAIGRAGGKAMCDAVVSDPNATLILAESTQTKFLDQCKVIFIVDPPKSLKG